MSGKMIYLLLFLLLIFIITYIDKIMIFLMIIVGILLILLLGYCIIKSILRLVYKPVLKHLTERGIVSRTDISIPDKLWESLLQSGYAIQLTSNYIMSPQFYNAFVGKLDEYSVISPKIFTDICLQCAHKFNEQYLYLIAAHTEKKNLLFSYTSQTSHTTYYLTSTFFVRQMRLFEIEGAVTQSEYASKILSAVANEIPVQEYTDLSKFLLDYLYTQEKITKVPLQPNSTMKETTLYCAVNRPENCRMKTNRISLD